jgi:hypothetical protein
VASGLKPPQEIGRVVVGEAGDTGELGDRQEAVALDVEEPQDGARRDDQALSPDSILLAPSS